MNLIIFIPHWGIFTHCYYQMSSCQTWQKTQVWHELNLQFQEFGKLPDYNTGGDTDIQGMLGTELGNLQTAIAHIHDVLLDPLHLVTENHGVAFGEGRVSLRQVLELGGAFYLLDAIYKVAFLLQLLYRLFGSLEIFPIYAVFATQCRLMNLDIGRGGGDSAEIHRLYTEGITGADKNTPVAKDQTVKPGDQPNAKDSIGNVGDLPEGTKFDYKTPVDTTTEGEKDATVVVTYPDGSKDEVPVKVIVKDPRTDADKNTPVAKDQTVKPGDQPNAKDSIGNVGDLPEGTKFEYKTPVDTTTEGEKDATVIVTYPDGSKDEVPVKVIVKDPRTDADKNTPTVDNQETKATPVPTVHKPAPASDTVHVASKATPAATDTKQALPETGENTSLLATLLGGLMTVAGLGLAGKRKKED